MTVLGVLGLILGDHGSGHDQCLAVCAVELLDDLPGLLDHGQLVLSDRNDRRVKSCDIGSLGNRISEETCRQSLVCKSAHLHLRFYSGIAGEAGCRDKVHIIKSQRMQRRKSGLHTDRRLGRIDSHRQIVQYYVDDVVSDLSGVVRIVGQRLVIGDQNIDLVEFAGILELYASLQRSDIVTEMQPSRRAVTG